jgi:hypothetical protein
MRTGTLGSDMRNLDPAVEFARVNSRYLPRSAMSIRSSQRQPSQHPGRRLGNSNRQISFVYRSPMALETISNLISGCTDTHERCKYKRTNEERSYIQDAGCMPLANDLNRVCGERLNLIGQNTQTSWSFKHQALDLDDLHG